MNPGHTLIIFLYYDDMCLNILDMHNKYFNINIQIALL